MTITNTTLGSRSGINHVTYGTTGYFQITNAHFENVIMDTDAYMIQTNLATGLKIENITFNSVTQVDSSDNSNSLIRLGTLSYDGLYTFDISSITAVDCSVSIFELSNLVSSVDTTQSLTISDITYTDSTFEFDQELVIFNQFESDSDIEVTIDGVDMQNLTFARYGSTFKFQQMTTNPVVVQNANFYNIYGSKFHIEQFDNVDESLTTHLIMYDVTVDELEGGINSFIHNLEGGILEVYDSTFGNSHNFEGGAIITGGVQDSVSSFYNCTFANNTAFYGGVANVIEGSVVRFYDSVISDNFAIESGVAQVSRDGSVEFHNTQIYENYALTVPVSEIFISSQVSIVNGCTVRDNTIKDKLAILSECTSQCSDL